MLVTGEFKKHGFHMELLRGQGQTLSQQVWLGVYWAASNIPEAFQIGPQPIGVTVGAVVRVVCFP